MNLFTDFDRTAWRDDGAHPEERRLTAPGGERVLARKVLESMRQSGPRKGLPSCQDVPFWSFYRYSTYIGQVFCLSADPLGDIASALEQARQTTARMEMQALGMNISPGPWLFEPSGQTWLSLEPHGDMVDVPDLPRHASPLVQCAEVVMMQNTDETMMILPLSHVGISIDVPTTQHARMERIHTLNLVLGI